MSDAVRWGLGAVGVALLAVGGWFLLGPILSGSTDPLPTAVWLLAGPLAIDLVVIPVAVLIGVGIFRWAPRPWRAPLATALALDAMLLVIAAPFLSGVGRKQSIPSLLDRDYVGGTGLLLAVVTMLCLVWGVVSMIMDRSGATMES